MAKKTFLEISQLNQPNEILEAFLCLEAHIREKIRNGRPVYPLRLEDILFIDGFIEFDLSDTEENMYRLFNLPPNPNGFETQRFEELSPVQINYMLGALLYRLFNKGDGFFENSIKIRTINNYQRAYAKIFTESFSEEIRKLSCTDLDIREEVVKAVESACDLGGGQCQVNTHHFEALRCTASQKGDLL